MAVHVIVGNVHIKILFLELWAEQSNLVIIAIASAQQHTELLHITKIPPRPGPGKEYMLNNNLLSRNPQCSGGVGRMHTHPGACGPCNCKEEPVCIGPQCESPRGKSEKTWQAVVNVSDNLQEAKQRNSWLEWFWTMDKIGQSHWYWGHLCNAADALQADSACQPKGPCCTANPKGTTAEVKATKSQCEAHVIHNQPCWNYWWDSNILTGMMCKGKDKTKQPMCHAYGPSKDSTDWSRVYRNDATASKSPTQMIKFRMKDDGDYKPTGSEHTHTNFEHTYNDTTTGAGLGYWWSNKCAGGDETSCDQNYSETDFIFCGQAQIPQANIWGTRLCVAKHKETGSGHNPWGASAEIDGWNTHGNANCDEGKGLPLFKSNLATSVCEGNCCAFQWGPWSRSSPLSAAGDTDSTHPVGWYAWDSAHSVPLYLHYVDYMYRQSSVIYQGYPGVRTRPMWGADSTTGLKLINIINDSTGFGGVLYKTGPALNWWGNITLVDSIASYIRDRWVSSQQGKSLYDNVAIAYNCTNCDTDAFTITARKVLGGGNVSISQIAKPIAPDVDQTSVPTEYDLWLVSTDPQPYRGHILPKP